MIESSISPAYSEILEREGGRRGRMTHNGLEYIVDRVGVAVEDESCYVHHAFSFTRKHSG